MSVSHLEVPTATMRYWLSINDSTTETRRLMSVKTTSIITSLISGTGRYIATVTLAAGYVHYFLPGDELYVIGATSKHTGYHTVRTVTSDTVFTYDAGASDGTLNNAWLYAVMPFRSLTVRGAKSFSKTTGDNANTIWLGASSTFGYNPLSIAPAEERTFQPGSGIWGNTEGIYFEAQSANDGAMCIFWQ